MTKCLSLGFRTCSFKTETVLGNLVGLVTLESTNKDFAYFIV